FALHWQKTKKPAPLPTKVLAYLEKAGVPHEVLSHRTVYTAFDAASTMKRKLNEIAKSLLIKADQDYYLVLLPADHNLDLKKLQTAIGKHAKKTIKVVKIPGEEAVAQVAKVKKQALTAFGGLHKLPVIIDENLAKAKKAVFSSGSANHSVELAVKDFIKHEQALLAKFGVKRIVKKVKKQVKKEVKKDVKIVKKALNANSKPAAKKIVKKK
ncbi:YbaK/EbsC family protein, partial [Candidatus Falkowbacteria bacterium]|nr:YbaK/EbsC family protein [Candidatus Falkowbacteria bacterium]